MGDFVLKLRGLEVQLSNTTANTVSNAALVRLISSANSTITVANAGVNVASITILGGNEMFLSKNPQDTILCSGAAVVNVSSVAFRD
jgi:hypothetical protein